MKVATNQERLNELFDADPKNDSAIAADLGVSKQTISAWRSGFRSPKKPMLLKIAEKYSVSIEWLMGFDTEKNASELPVFIPNTENWSKAIRFMDPDDYKTVLEIFKKAFDKMEKKGIIP